MVENRQQKLLVPNRISILYTSLRFDKIKVAVIIWALSVGSFAIDAWHRLVSILSICWHIVSTLQLDEKSISYSLDLQIIHRNLLGLYLLNFEGHSLLVVH